MKSVFSAGVFLFCLMKNPLLYSSARPESGREGREVFKIAPLARTQSERAPSACVERDGILPVQVSNPPTPSPPAMHYAAGSTSSRSGRRRGAPASACGHSAIALVAAFEVVGHILVGPNSKI